VSGLLGLKFWQIRCIDGLMLLVSGPSMVLAWFKLKKRNLDRYWMQRLGNHARVRINIPFGTSLTGLADCRKVPIVRWRSFAEEKPVWPYYCWLWQVMCVIGLWYAGLFRF